MLRFLVVLALAVTAYAASDLINCECEKGAVFGWDDQMLQINAYDFETDYIVCTKVCLLAKYAAVGQRRVGRSKRQADPSVPVTASGIAFNLQGPGVLPIPSVAGGAPPPPPTGPNGAPIPLPGYRHAINYNCVETCAAPQFHAPNCRFECQRHGQFHDAIQVAAPPRAVATAPVLPPKRPPPPPRPLALPLRPIGNPFGGPFNGPLALPNNVPFAAPFGFPPPPPPPIARPPRPFATLPISSGPGFSVATHPAPLIAPGPPVGPGPFGALPHGGAGPLNHRQFPLYNQVGLGSFGRVFPGGYRGYFGGQYGFGLAKK